MKNKILSLILVSVLGVAACGPASSREAETPISSASSSIVAESVVSDPVTTSSASFDDEEEIAIEDGYYLIRNAEVPSLVFSMDYAKDDDDLLAIYEEDEKHSQYFYVQERADGYVSIQDPVTERLLFGKTEEVAVLSDTESLQQSSLWTIRETEENHYQITNMVVNQPVYLYIKEIPQKDSEEVIIEYSLKSDGVMPEDTHQAEWILESIDENKAKARIASVSVLQKLETEEEEPRQAALEAEEPSRSVEQGSASQVTYTPSVSVADTVAVPAAQEDPVVISTATPVQQEDSDLPVAYDDGNMGDLPVATLTEEELPVAELSDDLVVAKDDGKKMEEAVIRDEIVPADFASSNQNATANQEQNQTSNQTAPDVVKDESVAPANNNKENETKPEEQNPASENTTPVEKPDENKAEETRPEDKNDGKQDEPRQEEPKQNETKPIESPDPKPEEEPQEKKIYTVRFENGFRELLTSQSVAEGGGATAPSDPTVEGYEFTGWDVDFSSIVSDTTVHAIWKLKVFTVQFVDPDGTIYDTQQVNYGRDAKAIAEPSKDGFDFVGWDGSIAYVTEDRVITARWESQIPIFTVAFEDGNGNVLNTQTVQDGGAAAAPTDPTREGYIFTGWDREFSSVNTDMTVVAQWEKKIYTVTFEDGDGNVLSIETVPYGDSASAPAAPQKEGYTFDKWDADFSNVAKDIVVRATWLINTYQVVFVDGYGATIKTETVQYGQSATAPGDPEHEDMIFVGWDKNFSSVSSDLTVIALWDDAFNEEDPQYRVTFMDGLGNTLSSAKVKQGESATAPADPTREGYDFTGWDVDFSNIQQTTVVNATWKAKTFAVAFIDGQGNTLKEEIVSYGENATAPTNPSRTGHTFDGWNGTYTNVKADQIVTAKWKINTYTVTFTDGLGKTLKSETVEYGKPATAPTNPTRTGYGFDGWDKLFTNITANTTVNAKWKINSYTVTFTDGQGAALKSQAVDHGASATAPTTPTRVGYTFDGWDKTFSNITSDLTVNAKWKINTYTVTFTDGQGVTLKTQTVNYGSDATAPANPTRTGYTFAGWDKAFTNVSSTLTVNAKWTINTYAVTFVDGQGHTLKTQSVNYNSAATAPADPTRDGYHFAGWDKTFNKITANTTVSAKWETHKWVVETAAKTVYHPEVSHYETVTVKPAYTGKAYHEEDVIYTYSAYVCNICQEEFETRAQVSAHLNSEHYGAASLTYTYRTDLQRVVATKLVQDSGTITVPAETELVKVIDMEAYTETIPATYVCSVCGEHQEEHEHTWVNWTKQVYHPEEGHWEETTLQEAGTVTVAEERPTCIQKTATQCITCGELFDTYDDFVMHALDTNHGTSRTVQANEIIGYETVKLLRYQATKVTGMQWVVDKAAYYSTEIGGQRCLECNLHQ